TFAPEVSPRRQYATGASARTTERYADRAGPDASPPVGGSTDGPASLRSVDDVEIAAPSAPPPLLSPPPPPAPAPPPASGSSSTRTGERPRERPSGSIAR